MSSKLKKKKVDKTKAKQTASSNSTASSSSDSDNDSEHELSYYIEDRIKLMKQITKILKTKKIKSMAPDCYKKLDISELNSMLLEELLGISNKRLKNIISGENNLDYSSSSDPDDDVDKPIDIISLDDISTDEDLMLIEDNDATNNPAGEPIKIKSEKKTKKKKKIHVKTEKTRKIKKEKDGGDGAAESQTSPKGSSDLMNVLELLELQARARAIRSQLALEAESKKKEGTRAKPCQINEDDDSDAVILDDAPKLSEIVISSTESEREDTNDGATSKRNESDEQTTESAKKVDEAIVPNVDAGGNGDEERTIENVDGQTEKNQSTPEKDPVQSESDKAAKGTKWNRTGSDNEEEVVVLNVDVEREEIEREISN